jgi:uncharacterized membrane protein HdeD (DUF308 family)
VQYAAAAPAPAYFSSPVLLGAFAFLLGIGAIAAALRRRRGKDRYPETYAASGGIIYTGVQMGCGAILLLAGAGLVVLALVKRG